MWSNSSLSRSVLLSGCLSCHHPAVSGGGLQQRGLITNYLQRAISPQYLGPLISHSLPPNGKLSITADLRFSWNHIISPPPQLFFFSSSIKWLKRPPLPLYPPMKKAKFPWQGRAEFLTISCWLMSSSSPPPPPPPPHEKGKLSKQFLVGLCHSIRSCLECHPEAGHWPISPKTIFSDSLTFSMKSCRQKQSWENIWRGNVI